MHGQRFPSDPFYCGNCGRLPERPRILEAWALPYVWPATDERTFIEDANSASAHHTMYVYGTFLANRHTSACHVLLLAMCYMVATTVST